MGWGVWCLVFGVWCFYGPVACVFLTDFLDEFFW